MICRSRPEILLQEKSTKHAWCAHLVLFLLLNTMQQNLLKAMLNNPEKTSTAWSKLPEPSNQSYLASKYIPRLIELSRYLLFIVVSSAKLFFENLILAHRPGWYCRLSLEDCYSNRLFCSHYKLPPLFRSCYREIVHCYYRFFSSEHFFAFFSCSNRTTRAVLISYCSSKRSKNKWIISAVLKLRKVITKTNGTQSRESKLKTLDIWPFLVSHVNHAREPLMIVGKPQIHNRCQRNF